MHTTLQQALERVPDGGPVLFGSLLAAGLALWLLGGRLAHLACGLMGLAVGTAAGSLLAWILALDGVVMLPILVLGAVLGAVLAVALFRAWVALCSAVVLAGVLPIAVLLWQQGAPASTPSEASSAAAALEHRSLTGDSAPELPPAEEDDTRPPATPQGRNLTPAPEEDRPPQSVPHAPTGNAALESALRQTVEEALDEKVQSKLEGLAESMRAAVPTELRELDDQSSLLSETASGRLARMLNQSRDTAGHSWQGVRATWQDLDAAAQTIFVLSAAVGGALGLMLGLVAPVGMSAGLGAILGTLLLLTGGYRLLHPLMPQQAESLFATPRGLVLSVSLIILTGLAIQWTIRRKRTDQ